MFDVTAFYAACSALIFIVFLVSLGRMLPHVSVVFIFILVTFTWRALATLYIDLCGPIFASQLQRVVGPGSSSVIQNLSYAVTLAPFLILLSSPAIKGLVSKASIERKKASADVTLADAAFVFSLIFVAALYFELFRIGVIPLLHNMERFDYTGKFASFLHVFLIEKGSLVSFGWGAIFAYNWIRERSFDWRFPALLLLVLTYAFLTGNRFSAFYTLVGFFVVPLSACVAFERYGNKQHTRQKQFDVTKACALVLVAAGFLAVIGLYNNLLYVRGYLPAEATARFVERALVQPSEMWWVSYERIFLNEQWDQGQAYKLLFSHPLEPSRNTTPQFLMSQVVSPERTYHHIMNGFQFAGGFPEVFFELFGPTYAWPMLFLAGLISAALCYIIIGSILRGALATAFLANYVLYSLVVMYIGGMLNFPLSAMYWVKCSVLVLAIAIEWRTSVRIIPWFLFTRTIEATSPVVQKYRLADPFGALDSHEG